MVIKGAYFILKKCQIINNNFWCDRRFKIDVIDSTYSFFLQIVCMIANINSCQKISRFIIVFLKLPSPHESIHVYGGVSLIAGHSVGGGSLIAGHSVGGTSLIAGHSVGGVSLIAGHSVVAYH